MRGTRLGWRLLCRAGLGAPKRLDPLRRAVFAEHLDEDDREAAALRAQEWRIAWLTQHNRDEASKDIGRQQTAGAVSDPDVDLRMRLADDPYFYLADVPDDVEAQA